MKVVIVFMRLEKSKNIVFKKIKQESMSEFLVLIGVLEYYSKYKNQKMKNEKKE
jgi:hypothetical protein